MELQIIQKLQKKQLEEKESFINLQYIQKIEDYLDKGKGECYLKDARIAGIVEGALQYFDGERYKLNAWTVMPNHVHVVMSLLKKGKETGLDDKLTSLAKILHSWKSYTSKESNKIIGRKGAFWQREYYDHLIRDEEEFEALVMYTVENPVKAGLCRDWKEWPWSGLRWE